LLHFSRYIKQVFTQVATVPYVKIVSNNDV